MRIYSLITALSFFSVSYAQNTVKWGKFSTDEINLTSVSFEPEANAVILCEEGILNITNYGYEVIEYSRIKILNPEGYEYSVLERTYNPQNYNSRVELIEGQTINFDNGKSETTAISKNDIFTENRNETTNVLKVVFPRVKVGSIIEYKLRIKSSADLFSSPWRFQNRIPALKSKLKIKNSSNYDYRVIQYGKLLHSKYGNAKGRKEWELTDVPSLKSYTHIYNPIDFADRIMIQHSPSNFQHGTYLSATNWTEFKKRLNKDIGNSNKNVAFRDFSNKIENGKTEIETLGNCIRYIQKNYRWKKKFSFIPYVLRDNLLRDKSGYSADLNLLLNGILKSKNISAELVLNSGRNNGKLLLNYPALSRIQALENLITLKNGEKILVDAAISDPKDVKFLDAKMYNQYVLVLNSPGESFLIIEPPLSELISINQLEIKSTDNINLKNKIQNNGYFKNLPIENYEFQQFNSYLVNENPVQEIDGWNIKTQLYTIRDQNLKLIELDCPFKNQFDQYQFETNRNYPIEIEFPYRLITQITFKENQYYDVHAENFNQEISAFDGKLNYRQLVDFKDDDVTITWILLVNKSIFSPQELTELKKFILNYKIITNNSVLLKN